jgi:hypothetical protein
LSRNNIEVGKFFVNFQTAVGMNVTRKISFLMFAKRKEKKKQGFALRQKTQAAHNAVRKLS